ncbi:uncharacterized protein BT62DRAFT_912981, partial [Guyanagaster necrorhizus]
VDIQLERLQAQRQVLLSPRTKKEGFLFSHKALVSPIRSLSTETLQEIFVPSHPDDHNAVMLSKQSSLLLTHVRT